MLALLTVGAVIIAVLASLLIFRGGTALGRLATAPILERLSTAPAADGQSAVDQAPQDQVQFLRFVVSDIQDAWSKQFADAGMTYQ
ncbi:MAG: hypothetical protein QOF49_802, partial [Chloroflexota bacterium]|nr:hypothetical protein [Chloroflexota bacterium]